jgi:hypothetical protein
MVEGVHIVRKSEFASMRNVSPGRVTQWISAGQIGPEALVGAGRNARINVQIANAHLRERLDPGQRFGLNGITTRLDDAPAPAPPPPAPRETPLAPPPVVDTIEARIKAEKLRQAELTTRRAEEQDRLSRGVYILARDARDENTRVAAKMFEAFDGAITDFASAISAKFKVPARDVTHLLRAEMRKVRERAAAEFATLAAAEPETIDDLENHDEPRLQ